MLTGELPIQVSKREQIPLAQKSLKPFPANLSTDCKDLLSKLLVYDSNKRISFQELFVHPFITMEKTVPESKKDEVIEINDVDEIEEDFILLDKDESIHEMVVFQKDTHPMINIPEIITGFSLSLELAFLLEKIATKCKANKDIFMALALYLKASSILESKIHSFKDLIHKFELSSGNFPSLHEKYERIKLKFQELMKKGDVLSRRPAFKAENLQKLSIETFLIDYAIELCSEAAKSEYLNDYNISKSKYSEAITLLDHLAKSHCSEESKNKLDIFISETHRRLNKVIVKISLS